MRVFWSGSAFTIALLMLSDPSLQAAQIFYPLSDLGGGSYWSEGRAVSANGSTVVGYSGPAPIRAYSWTPASGMAALTPSGSSSEAEAVSADGSVIAGSSTVGLSRWTSGGGAVSIGLLPGGNNGAVRGISGNGNVIVGGSSSANSTSGYYEAFRWTAQNGMTGLGDLSGGVFGSFAEGVSADGNVVVGSANSAAGQEAFRWNEIDGMMSLGDLAGGEVDSKAWDVSGDGSVIVGYGTGASGRRAFRWTSSAGMISLGNLGSVHGFSEARAASGDGSIIVGVTSLTGGLGSGPFIWDATNGMRSISDLLTTQYGVNLNGWMLIDAQAISADGRTITGSAYDQVGRIHGWVAVIPEPTGLPVVTLLVSLLARRRR